MWQHWIFNHWLFESREKCVSSSKVPIHVIFLISKNCCCLVAQLCLTLGPHGLQHARLPCPSLSPKVCSNSRPLSWWCHPTISSFVAPCPPAINPSQHQGLFQRVGSSHQAAKISELQFWHQSFQWIFRISTNRDWQNLCSYIAFGN